MSSNKISQAEAKRRLKNGSYSTVITIVVIAVLIIINLIVSALPSSFTKFDFSEQEFLVLSEQTEELLDNLDTDVTIYYLAESGTEDTITEELVEKYASLSSKITVKKIDTALNPTFTQAYTSGEVEDNSLVVESENRYKYIAYEDIYTTTTSTSSDGTTTSSSEFDGENQLTSAIDYVASDDLPMTYALTGHSESDIPEDLISDLETQNIEVSTLNLIQTGEIPEDCKSLILFVPQDDITSDEAALIQEYIDGGGSMMVVFTRLYADDTPNIDALLANYGITVLDGMVMEGDSNYTYQNYGNYIFAQLESHTITDPLIDSNLNVMVIYGEAVTFEEDEEGTLSAVSFLYTTSQAYIKAIDATTTEKEDGDTSGAMALALAVEKETESEDDDSTGKIVVYTTPLLFDSTADEMTAGGNFDLVINSFGWLCEHESSISIHSKSLSATSLTVSSFQANLWSTILVAVLPLLLIVIGIVIWIVRRLK